MIYLGADHGGYELKEQLKTYLVNTGLTVTDLGPSQMDPDDDYPIVAAAVARKVAEDLANRGVLLCRNGAGVCIAANKIPGIRAAQAWSIAVAESIRHDDDANVVCLPADYLSFAQAQAIVQKFLATPLGEAGRYVRRLRQIADLEQGK